jgi:aryl-alcohol dehydrogenase (NADP+)
VEGRNHADRRDLIRRLPAEEIPMETVNLGRTGLKVTKLCLGCMTYGTQQWREWVLPEAESRPFLKRALELGINFFDTANI